MCTVVEGSYALKLEDREPFTTEPDDRFSSRATTDFTQALNRLMIQSLSSSCTRNCSKNAVSIHLPNLSFVTDQRLNPLVVEPFDVYSMLSNLNPAKCTGFKNLPNRLLKSCSRSLATPLSLLFNFILVSVQFPFQ